MRRHRWLDFIRRFSERVVEAFDWRYRISAGQLTVERVAVSLPPLPRAFQGYTIAQLSDFHFGPLVEPHSLHLAIDVALELKPALITLTGDFVSRLTHGEAQTLTEALRRLHAPHGVFGVLGNHDWWEDADEVACALQAAGIRVLRNEHVALRRGEATLYLAGVDDVHVRRADLTRALADVPCGAATILLAHEPYFAEAASRDGRVGLQLSGHSHGGQIMLPHLDSTLLRFLGHHRYPRGLNRVRGMHVYTTRGLGVVGLPLRVNCPPEVTLITLQSEER
ncbi:MAG: metallophosphoesterase [Anaerolineales bacterium]